MDKKEALKELAATEEKLAKLRKIIEAPENYIDIVKTYSQVCKKLGEKEFTLSDFTLFPEYLRKKMLAIAKINQIAKLFNGSWKPNWTNTSQYKWRPCFDKQSGRWAFDASFYYYCYSNAAVVYYESEKISDYIGKTFMDIYIDIMEE